MRASVSTNKDRLILVDRQPAKFNLIDRVSKLDRESGPSVRIIVWKTGK